MGLRRLPSTSTPLSQLLGSAVYEVWREQFAFASGFQIRISDSGFGLGFRTRVSKFSPFQGARCPLAPHYTRFAAPVMKYIVLLNMCVTCIMHAHTNIEMLYVF